MERYEQDEVIMQSYLDVGFFPSAIMFLDIFYRPWA